MARWAGDRRRAQQFAAIVGARLTFDLPGHPAAVVGALFTYRHRRLARWDAR